MSSFERHLPRIGRSFGASAPLDNGITHDANDLIRIFNTCFKTSHQTQLILGDGEPLYLPKNTNLPYHTIYFAHGFFRSALHECAHWFLAGEKRRLLEDYGYWYIPDGRNNEEQNKFLEVEVKPQALEWIFCVTAGYPFRPSFDNLNGATTAAASFMEKMLFEITNWCQKGLPPRARKFQEALSVFYNAKIPLLPEQFCNEL